MAVKIEGIQKLTLLDYPGKIGCTIFTDGCNFKCPFCHNNSLIANDKSDIYILEEEVISFLNQRKNVLTGVCISGGEPLVQKDIKKLIKKIKDIGYNIKLDTNGSNPKVLKELVESNLIDCVAMDIKNSIEKYPATTGCNPNVEDIKKSINYLLNSKIDYEFRTTVVKEYHSYEDFIDIGKLIKGAKNYYLQAFEDKECISERNLHAYSKSEMENIKECIKPYVENVDIRGI